MTPTDGAPLAQWIRRQPPELEIVGSSPAGSIRAESIFIKCHVLTPLRGAKG